MRTRIHWQARKTAHQKVSPPIHPCANDGGGKRRRTQHSQSEGSQLRLIVVLASLFVARDLFITSLLDTRRKRDMRQVTWTIQKLEVLLA